MQVERELETARRSPHRPRSPKYLTVEPIDEAADPSPGIRKEQPEKVQKNIDMMNEKSKRNAASKVEKEKAEKAKKEKVKAEQ